jgi:hypothetical protein
VKFKSHSKEQQGLPRDKTHTQSRKIPRKGVGFFLKICKIKEIAG